MSGCNHIVEGNVRGRDDFSEVRAYTSQRMLSIGGLRPDGGDSCHCRAADVNNVERSGMSGSDPRLAKHVVCVRVSMCVCVCRGWGEYLQMDRE